MVRSTLGFNIHLPWLTSIPCSVRIWNKYLFIQNFGHGVVEHGSPNSEVNKDPPFMAAFQGSQNPLNTPMAPSPYPAVHEHATASFHFTTRGSNHLAHASSVFQKHVPLHLLENITNGFSKDRELGTGAYGKVYKGVHKNGETISVKVLYSKPGMTRSNLKEFCNLTSLHHKNIERLVGFCYKTQREFVSHNAKMIFADATHIAFCFEYMHNGSLDIYFFDEYTGNDWPTRYSNLRGSVRC